MSKSNAISWSLRNNQGYTLTKQLQHKLTHLLYVEELKTYHKTPTKAMMEMRRMESMFSDIGLEWGLHKCATVAESKVKLVSAENLILNKKLQKAYTGLPVVRVTQKLGGIELQRSS